MKSLFALILMLIIPVIAMIGIFNLGSQIIAPPDIKGDWINNNDLSKTNTCIPNSLTHLSINQSGKFLTLNFDGDSDLLIKGKLSIDGEIITNNEYINLNAVLVNKTELLGQIFVSGCEDPISIQFTRLKPLN